MVAAPEVVFGTAQLFGLTEAGPSRQVLETAWEAGFRRFDTAPSYGGGRAEAELGALLGARRSECVVTTKVGLAPVLGSRSGGRHLVQLARTLLPEAVTQRLRRSTHARASGLFEPASVRRTLEESLRRLGGRVDRYLLHEVSPEEVTDGLLGVLQAALDSGDVGAVGVATGNGRTAAAAAAGAGVLTVAQYAVGPLDQPVQLPPAVTTRVGHGLLGAGGGQLASIHGQLEGPGELGARWRAAVDGTVYAGPGGLARALLARRPPGVTEVLVATTKPGRVAETRSATLAGPPPPIVQAVLAEAVARARTT